MRGVYFGCLCAYVLVVAIVVKDKANIPDVVIFVFSSQWDYY